MYRAVTLFALGNHFISEEKFNQSGLITQLPAIDLQFKFNPELGFSEMYLNGENVENEIRSMNVSNFVSQVAAVPEVREILVRQQQKMGREKGVVMDGRDIGTVVFPEAELKLFMTASAKIRAERRFKELKEKDETIAFDEVLANVKERDHLDSNRNDSPLRKADDALEIDNSDLTPQTQFDKILTIAKRRIKLHPK